VSFENLVSEPQTVLEDICHFLGLEFVSEMLQPYKEKQHRMTDGINEMMPMIGDPKFHQHTTIDASAAHRWKKHEAHDRLGPKTWELAESLGYVREGLTREFMSRHSSMKPPVSEHDAEALLARIKQLSDEQVDALLKAL
jgi:hypothetical protein